MANSVMGIPRGILDRPNDPGTDHEITEALLRLTLRGVARKESYSGPRKPDSHLS